MMYDKNRIKRFVVAKATDIPSIKDGEHQFVEVITNVPFVPELGADWDRAVYNPHLDRWFFESDVFGEPTSTRMNGAKASYKQGEYVWIKESFLPLFVNNTQVGVQFLADWERMIWRSDSDPRNPIPGNATDARLMRKRDSRFTMLVTDVRVEKRNGKWCFIYDFKSVKHSSDVFN